MSFDYVLGLIYCAGMGALCLVPIAILVGRKRRALGRVLFLPLVLSIGCVVYSVSPPIRPASVLYTDAFKESPDSTITDLKACQSGSSGYYRGFIQFHAPPETAKRLQVKITGFPFGDEGISPDISGRREMPRWFRVPQKTTRFYFMDRSIACVGHFGITFQPDVAEFYYDSTLHLVQVYWDFYD